MKKITILLLIVLGLFACAHFESSNLDSNFYMDIIQKERTVMWSIE